MMEVSCARAEKIARRKMLCFMEWKLEEMS
jgi:hypothetical protein